MTHVKMILGWNRNIEITNTSTSQHFHAILPTGDKSKVYQAHMKMESTINVFLAYDFRSFRFALPRRRPVSTEPELRSKQKLRLLVNAKAEAKTEVSAQP